MLPKLRNLLGCGLLMLLIGCGSASTTVVERSYTGAFTNLTDAAQEQYGVTHALKTDMGEVVLMKSDLYDLDSPGYRGAELQVKGVVYESAGQETLVVNSIMVLRPAEFEQEPEDDEVDLDEQDEDNAEVDEDEESDSTLVDEDEDEPVEVDETDNEDDPEKESSYTDLTGVNPDLSKYGQLESRYLKFKSAFPLEWNYAQIGQGYAFADEPVEDTSELWTAYIAVDSEVVPASLGLPASWPSYSAEVDGRIYTITGAPEFEQKLLEILSTIENAE